MEKMEKHTACAAIYWEPEHEKAALKTTPWTTNQNRPRSLEKDHGWNMYWVDERISALIAYKIALSAGYEAYLLWDTGLNNWCLLTDHGSEVLDQIP